MYIGHCHALGSGSGVLCTVNQDQWLTRVSVSIVFKAFPMPVLFDTIWKGFA